MELDGDNLIVFTSLYEKEYRVTLTPQKAREEFSKLLQLYKLVYLTPLPIIPQTDKTVVTAININRLNPQKSLWYNVGATREIIK